MINLRISASGCVMAASLLLWNAACGQTESHSAVVMPPDGSAADGNDAIAESIDIPEPATCPVGHEPPGVAPAPPLALCIPAGPDPILAGVMATGVPTSSLGRLDPQTAEFHPYVPGQWAKLQPGLQGVGHVEMRLHLLQSGAPPGEPLVVEIAREVWFDCDTRLPMAPSKQKFVAAAKPGWWVPSSYMATIVPRPPWLGCGRWALFRTFWRLPGAANWQKAEVTVRLYLADTVAPVPP